MQIIIFFIILSLIAFIFNYYYSDIVNDNIQITFLSSQLTNDFIKRDDDNYINNFSNADLHARNVTSKEEYINIILESTGDFNDNDKDKLTKAAKLADIFFENNIHYVDSIISEIPWIFSKLINNKYEDGYPHTRKNIIFLSNNVIDQYKLCKLAKLLIHEKIHIYQRYFPDKLYNYMKNYEKIKERKLEPLSRSNPDLDEWIYAYKPNMELLKATYKSETPKNLADIIVPNNDSKFEHPYEFMAYDIIQHFTCN